MIQERAMLARLSISKWTARKYDKGVSTEVEAAHAAKDAGRYNKLLVDKALLEPIVKLESAARTYHYGITLPWTDEGDRLLPAKLFADYTQSVRMFRSDFDKRVQELLAKYPTEVNAARNRLGTMYNPLDYPTVGDLRDKYKFKVEFIPVPSAKDFRVDVSEAAAAEIRTSITEATDARLNSAVKHIYTRMREMVSKVSERCTTKDARIFDSLIENVADFVEILPALNLNDDPILTALHAELVGLAGVNVQSLRDRPDVRQRTADVADAILAKLPWA